MAKKPFVTNKVKVAVTKAKLSPPQFKFGPKSFNRVAITIPDAVPSFMPVVKVRKTKDVEEHIKLTCYHGETVNENPSKVINCKDGRVFTKEASYSCGQQQSCGYEFGHDHLMWLLSSMSRNKVKNFPCVFVCTTHATAGSKLSSMADPNPNEKRKIPIIRCAHRSGSGQETKYCPAELILTDDYFKNVLKEKTGETDNNIVKFVAPVEEEFADVYDSDDEADDAPKEELSDDEDETVVEEKPKKKKLDEGETKKNRKEKELESSDDEIEME